MPEPDLFTGPLLPDAAKAAGTGITLGGIAGFVFASVLLSLERVEEILKWASYTGLLAGVFAVVFVLSGRVA